MKNAYLSGLAVATLLLFGSIAAHGQSTRLHVDDSGAIIPAHQSHHTKVGNKITWIRHSGANKSWFVKFDSSPCAEGNLFGSGGVKTCTVKVTCTTEGDAGCKAYKYSSATGPNAPLNDPEIVVDPANGAGIPQFPWPPPEASARQIVARTVLTHGQTIATLGDLNAVLSAALDRNAYTEKSYFAIPNGFVIVTRLEQIEVDGKSKMLPDRWLSQPSTVPSTYSIRSYLAALFTAKAGYYRVIAFAVTDVPFAQTSARISEDEAMRWLSAGFNILPREIGAKPYGEAVACTALIYEFERQQGKNATILLPSRLDAGTHLAKAGLLGALGATR